MWGARIAQYGPHGTYPIYTSPTAGGKAVRETETGFLGTSPTA